MPKPTAMLPIDLAFLIKWPMIRMMPMMSAIGARVEGWKNLSHAVPEESMSKRRMICPVTVVPTFAPTMMPSDWRSVRMPAPTRPEVMTIVAVDDWISAVTKMPRRNALKELFVTFSMALLSVPEEFSFRESPIRRMP